MQFDPHRIPEQCSIVGPSFRQYERAGRRGNTHRQGAGKRNVQPSLYQWVRSGHGLALQLGWKPTVRSRESREARGKPALAGSVTSESLPILEREPNATLARDSWR